MARKTPGGAHQEIIQRLLDAEREGRSRVGKAREEGEKIVEKARREADEETKKIMEEARDEAERIVRKAEERTVKPTNFAAAGIGDIDAFRLKAEENMGKAVRFLVAQVTER